MCRIHLGALDKEGREEEWVLLDVAATTAAAKSKRSWLLLVCRWDLFWPSLFHRTHSHSLTHRRIILIELDCQLGLIVSWMQRRLSLVGIHLVLYSIKIIRCRPSFSEVTNVPTFYQAGLFSVYFPSLSFLEGQGGVCGCPDWCFCRHCIAGCKARGIARSNHTRKKAIVKKAIVIKKLLKNLRYRDDIINVEVNRKHQQQPRRI